MYKTAGCPGTPVAARVRPPRKGPIMRQRICWYKEAGICWALAAPAEASRPAQTAMNIGTRGSRITRTSANNRAAQDKPWPGEMKNVRTARRPAFRWCFYLYSVRTPVIDPLHQPGAACITLGLPVEHSAANGELSLNCLSHLRGQAQFTLFDREHNAADEDSRLRCSHSESSADRRGESPRRNCCQRLLCRFPVGAAACHARCEVGSRSFYHHCVLDFPSCACRGVVFTIVRAPEVFGFRCTRPRGPQCLGNAILANFGRDTPAAVLVFGNTGRCEICQVASLQ